MKPRTPETRFLGVPAGADDHALLGLEPDAPLTREALSVALERRLATIDRHPARMATAAQSLRRRLNDARSRLIDTGHAGIDAPAATPSEVSTPTVRSTGIGITPFDRMILSKANSHWVRATRPHVHSGLSASFAVVVHR